MLTNCLAACTHAPIFNSFPVIRTASAKNRHFHVPQPTFLFPWSSPCNYHIICCMDGKTIQCMPNSRSMYLSIFNSFRIIRCLSQCVSPKIVIFTTFLFPVETPLGQSRYVLYGWKENSMLTNCLAACTHLSSTVSQLFEPQLRKIAIFTYRSPRFCFPWRRPCDYHAIWMERELDACQTPCSMYISIFNSFRVIRCSSQCVIPKIAIFITFLFPLGTSLWQSRKTLHE